MLFDRHMAATFRKLGRSAIYTPPAGAVVPCQVMPATKPLQFGELELPVGVGGFDLLRKEVTPAVGGVLNVGGVTYPVDVPVVPFPPDQDPDGLRWRLLCGWGLPAVYQITAGGSRPRGSEWVVAADAPAGADAVTISGTLASGQLRPGDAFTVPGHPAAYVAAGAVAAVGGRFPSVPVSPALSAPVAAGTPVLFAFAADCPVRAYPLAAAGTLAGSIVTSATTFLIIAGSLPAEPTPGNSLAVGGRVREVVGVFAHNLGTTPLAWEVQVK
ncbi:hypothetical protein [Azospirillum rugosum]|uniref:Uncharacterized protein n=1 Tax=Azospirillum rugosum TaxID=416170 RepID=A0ABS4SEP7_9PROT|nr:hypothetical protein [Azospirillum rugosum]MBP2291041.1 hypothetical protein [Azospirillum rugosum]MDQ0524895.1 hypothetical protein [Azospirillum rugosum]